MESPTSAALRAGPSFVPSPVTPTTSPTPPTSGRGAKYEQEDENNEVDGKEESVRERDKRRY